MRYILNFTPEIKTTLNVENKYLFPFLDDGYMIVSHSDEGYVICKAPIGTITEESDDYMKRRVCYPREFMRRRYRKSDVTKEDFEHLIKELEDGLVSFDDIYMYNRWLKGWLCILCIINLFLGHPIYYHFEYFRQISSNNLTLCKIYVTI